MCGIIGIVAKESVAPGLLEGLRRLEYRGYDSAGIATLTNGHIECRRAKGKLINLARRLDQEPVHGVVGIGHTRWATHGLPTETNAHPIVTDRVAVAHNGIIENFQRLRSELKGLGYVFQTDTDTEAVAILATHFLGQGLSPQEAVAKTLTRIEGVFALVFLFAGEHDLLIGARRGSPLAIGYGEGEMFLGSDALALAPLTRRITYLEEGDRAVVTSRAVAIFDAANREVVRPVRESAASGALIGKGDYPHFMLKEIFEQPAVIGDTLNAVINPATRAVHLPELCFELGEFGPCDGYRLRHLLPRRSSRQILARADRPRFGGDRHCLGVPLSGASNAARRSSDLRLSIGRNRRHPGGAALCPRPGPEDHRHR